MEKIEKSRNRLHGEAIGSYSVFILGGKKYFQIDTYGTLDREIPNVISQTIQIDKESAEYLIELLKNEFIL